MNSCLNCSKSVNNKYCNTYCQNAHQGSLRANTRYGNIKDFTVSCETCKNNFIVQEREKMFPKKSIYYCSRSCSNKRVHSEKTKDKIKNSLNIHYKNKNTKPNDKKLKLSDEILNCIVCNKNFMKGKKRTRKTCSKECRKNLYKIQGSLGGKKSAFNKKQYDINMITYIYALTDENENIRYIGKSNNVEIRYRYHLKESKQKRTHKEKWINSMLEKNIKPGCFILEECAFSDWILMEEFWISLAKSWGFNLTNGTSGGEGSNGFKGKKHSEETKQKLREKTLMNIEKRKNIIKSL